MSLRTLPSWLRWPSEAGVRNILSAVLWAALAGLALGLSLGMVLRIFLAVFGGHGVFITVS